MPAGLPEGWKAVEQACGEKSKTPGVLYVRYKRVDGTCKVTGPKQVVQAHCDALGIPWEPEYAKYEAAQRECKEAKRKEKEAAEKCEGEKREEMAAVSREHLGDYAINGPLQAQSIQNGIELVPARPKRYAVKSVF